MRQVDQVEALRPDMRVKIGKEWLRLVMPIERHLDPHPDGHLTDGDRASLQDVEFGSLGIELDEVHETQVLVADDVIKRRGFYEMAFEPRVRLKSKLIPHVEIRPEER